MFEKINTYLIMSSHRLFSPGCTFWNQGYNFWHRQRCNRRLTNANWQQKTISHRPTQTNADHWNLRGTNLSANVKYQSVVCDDRCIALMFVEALPSALLALSAVRNSANFYSTNGIYFLNLWTAFRRWFPLQNEPTIWKKHHNSGVEVIIHSFCIFCEKV